MILLEGIEKTFGNQVVLENFSYSFKKSSTTVLLGQSGSGKSTIIRLIAGLEKSDEGSITVDEVPLNENSLNSIRQKLGYVIQEGGLFPHLTALENIRLPANYFKVNETTKKERVRYLIELTKYSEELLNKYPSQLSGGERQRVSLMRALILDPPILLLDEPLGALDPLIRYDLQNDLKEIFHKLDKTVILVTHDLSEALFFGDQIVLLNKGKIEQEGDPDKLLNEPSSPYVKKFINAQRDSGIEN